MTELARKQLSRAAWCRRALAMIVCSAAVLSLSSQASAQICKPVSQRTGEVGCWIIAHEPVGQLTASQAFWHLDAYPTRAAAECRNVLRQSQLDSAGTHLPRSGDRCNRVVAGRW